LIFQLISAATIFSPNAVTSAQSQQLSSSASSNSIGASPSVALSPNVTGVLSVTQQLLSSTTTSIFISPNAGASASSYRSSFVSSRRTAPSKMLSTSAAASKD
jgi:hypothetical protein